MKRIKTYILCTLAAAAALSGCRDDEWATGQGVQIEEGVAVNLTLAFNTTAQTVKTRVVQSTATEYNVNSLYLFVFDADGNVEYADEPEFTGGTYNENEGTTSGTISGIDISSGYQKKIYAIANIDPDGNEGGDISTTPLADVKTESDLWTLAATLNNTLQVNRLSFLMTGGLNTDENSTDVLEVDIDSDGTIYPSGSPTSISKPTIYLHRIDARITFNIEIGTIIDNEASSTSNAEFTPRNFEVHNLPGNSALFPQGTLDSYKYDSMDESTYQTFDTEGDGDEAISFNFYMFENNIVVPSSDTKHYIDDNKNTDKLTYLYLLREKEVKDSEGLNQEPAEYRYAPDTATYVVIRGDLSYEREKGGITQYVNAAVTYTVHLGETGNTECDWNNPEKVNNYVAARNTHYTYTVTIQGVNSIRVEVYNDKEEQPGNEGDVIVAGAQVNQLDCHYGRALFKLSRSALQNEETPLTWSIKTPFSRGVKRTTDSDLSQLADYKWVLFAVNKEFGISPTDPTTNMVQFPGYGAYDGGADTTDNTANTDTGNRGNWKNNMSSDNYWRNNNRYNNVTSDACLRDVNQLLNHLKEEAKDGSSTIFESEDGVEYVYVTAFIDEYVYRYDPSVEEYISPAESFGTSSDEERRKLLWKETVNSDTRMMHISVGEPKQSTDGSSSWTESVVSFIQRPVYSIYDESADGLESAWGTESIIEGEALPAIPVKDSYVPQNGITYSNSTDNGRINTLMFFVNSSGNYRSDKTWSEALSNLDTSLDTNNELGSNYRDIWHACLVRNRDLNGNNYIEPNEIRWFLASVDELTDLWIGEDALPSSAALYQGDGTVRIHVASSSYNGSSPTDPWVIWAEEGASRGAYSASYKEDGSGNSNGKNYLYRCIRYLGIDPDEIGTTPQDYVEVNRESSTTGTIYVTYLSRLAKRDASDNGYELPLHYERGTDDVNKPYTGGFRYDLTPKGNGATARCWNTETWEEEVNGTKVKVSADGFYTLMNYGGTSQLCPSGWRVPNQRELMLMMTSIDDWTSGNYWSSTQFSFNGNSLYTNRPGFSTNVANLILINTDVSANTGANIPSYVRPVQDR